MWSAASEDADQEAEVAEYARAILLDEGNTAAAAAVDLDPEPARSGLVLLGVGGVLVLTGVLAFVLSLPATNREHQPSG